MENDEIPYLKNEIIRLNKIITVLINQNDALSDKISYLENAISNGNIDQPYDKGEKGAINTVSPFHQMEKGAINVTSPYDQMDKGALNIISSVHQMEKGIVNVISPLHQVEKGTVNVTSPFVKSDIGVNENAKILPNSIPITGVNLAVLKNTIGKKYFFRVKHDGVDAMLKILLQIHNKDGCTYVDLRRLTNRSHGGMSKLVKSLKKRGLVERTGKSKMRLTDKAMQYLRDTTFQL
jgi:hypothetical protein